MTFAADVAACRACELAGYLARAHPITPSLLEAPRMMLIGQAPGPVTDRLGYHFAGPAGRFLEQWLEQAGFPPGYFRAHVYLTSLTRCFPGKSAAGNGDRPPSRAEMALCRAFLEREFELFQPRVVLLVGKMAGDAFLGQRPLGETVGRVFVARADAPRGLAPVESPALGRSLSLPPAPLSAGERYFLPLPHASGVSRWLNAPANRALLRQALTELARLRVELGLA